MALSHDEVIAKVLKMTETEMLPSLEKYLAILAENKSGYTEQQLQLISDLWAYVAKLHKFVESGGTEL